MNFNDQLTKYVKLDEENELFEDIYYNTNEHRFEIISYQSKDNSKSLKKIYFNGDNWEDLQTVTMGKQSEVTFKLSGKESGNPPTFMEQQHFVYEDIYYNHKECRIEAFRSYGEKEAKKYENIYLTNEGWKLLELISSEGYEDTYYNANNHKIEGIKINNEENDKTYEKHFLHKKTPEILEKISFNDQKITLHLLEKQYKHNFLVSSLNMPVSDYSILYKKDIDIITVYFVQKQDESNTDNWLFKFHQHTQLLNSYYIEFNQNKPLPKDFREIIEPNKNTSDFDVIIKYTEINEDLKCYVIKKNVLG
ncbi:hypothetical protein QTN25_005711 [Entamoeba marina]